MMAFIKYTKFTTYCLIATLALSSCAKKNNDLKARVNAAGARDINPANSQAADQLAAANNFDTEFLKISNPVMSGSGLSITTTLRNNSYTYNIVTTHVTYGLNSQPASTTQMIGGGNFSVSAVCGNEYCNPYYIIVNITANGREIKQMGQMKYFYNVGDQSLYDVFFSKQPGQFLPIPQAIAELNAGSQQVQAEAAQ